MMGALQDGTTWKREAYFDWNHMDYVDLRYYRVKIARFDGHSEVDGRDALIDREHAVIHLINR
jgi:hypothetical protein